MAEPDPLEGRKLSGRFVVERFLEEEVLGRVYAARDSKGDLPVRIKVPHPFLAENAEKMARFEREFRATTRVAHGNVLRALGGGRHEGRLFFVLEAFDGAPLADQLANGPLAPERAAAIVARAARGLEVAHAAGIVHRNLSPSALLVSADDRVKVRDFGLCWINREDSEPGIDRQLTSRAARIGNIAYMAPEYIEQWTIDTRVDVYALGALLFHLLVGKPPYEGKYAQVLDGHMNLPIPQPTRLRTGLPPWTDAVVTRLMDKDPGQRPATGEGVARLLEEAVGRPLAEAEMSATPARARRRLAVPLAVVGAVAVVGTLIAFAWLLELI